MDDATTSNDIRLREGASIAQRLIKAGFAAAVALCFTPGLFTHDTLEVIISVIALLLGAAFIGGVMLAPAVVWIITPDEILIGQQRPFGKLRTRIVAKDDITGLQVLGNKAAKARFQLAFALASGERLTSPPISDVTHVRDTVARIIAGEPQTMASWSAHDPYRVTTSASVPTSAPERIATTPNGLDSRMQRPIMST